MSLERGLEVARGRMGVVAPARRGATSSAGCLQPLGDGGARVSQLWLRTPTWCNCKQGSPGCFGRSQRSAPRAEQGRKTLFFPSLPSGCPVPRPSRSPWSHSGPLGHPQEGKDGGVRSLYYHQQHRGLARLGREAAVLKTSSRALLHRGRDKEGTSCSTRLLWIESAGACC